jgi:amino acid permease
MMTLGLVPGMTAIITIGILTGYTAYQFLQIYRRYPTIVNIADIGYHLGGRYLEWLFGITLVLMMCLTAASCALTLSIALNYISNHGACTVGFIGLASLVSCALCVPRSMKFCAKMGWPATISIIAAILGM